MAGDAFVVVGAHGRHQFQRIVFYDVRDVVEVLDETRPHPVEVIPVLRLVVPHENGVGADVLLVVEEAAIVVLRLLIVGGDLLAFLGEAREEPGPAEIHGVPGEEAGVLHFVDALGIVAVALVVTGYGHVDKAGPESGLDFFLGDLEVDGPEEQLVPVFLDFPKFSVEGFRVLHEVQHGADRRPVRGSVGHKEDEALALAGLEVDGIVGDADRRGLGHGVMRAFERSLVGMVYGGGDLSGRILGVNGQDLVVAQNGVASQFVSGFALERVVPAGFYTRRHAFVAQTGSEIRDAVAGGDVLHRHFRESVQGASRNSALNIEGEHLEGVLYPHLLHRIVDDRIDVVFQIAVAVLDEIELRPVHKHQFRRPVVKVPFRRDHEAFGGVHGAQLVRGPAVIAERFLDVDLGRDHRVSEGKGSRKQSKGCED